MDPASLTCQLTKQNNMEVRHFTISCNVFRCWKPKFFNFDKYKEDFRFADDKNRVGWYTYSDRVFSWIRYFEEFETGTPQFCHFLH